MQNSSAGYFERGKKSSKMSKNTYFLKINPYFTGHSFFLCYIENQTFKKAT